MVQKEQTHCACCCNESAVVLNVEKRMAKYGSKYWLNHRVRFDWQIIVSKMAVSNDILQNSWGEN